MVFFLGLLVIAELSHSGVVRFRTLPRWSAAAFSVVVLLAASALLLKAGSTANQLIAHWRNHPAHSDPTLDDHWNRFITGATAVIEEHRTRPSVSLWSEYAALLDARYKTLQAGEDYIIHAIGPGA